MAITTKVEESIRPGHLFVFSSATLAAGAMLGAAYGFRRSILELERTEPTSVDGKPTASTPRGVQHIPRANAASTTARSALSNIPSEVTFNALKAFAGVTAAMGSLTVAAFLGVKYGLGVNNVHEFRTVVRQKMGNVLPVEKELLVFKAPEEEEKEFWEIVESVKQYFAGDTEKEKA